MTGTDSPTETLQPTLVGSQLSGLSIARRLEKMYQLFDPKDVLVTTSFGANSAVLLHAVTSVCPTQRVVFIDTGFHFPETLQYARTLSDRFDLQLEIISPDSTLHDMVVGKRLWESLPEVCCFLSKVYPLEQLKSKYKIWVSGIMAFQTKERKKAELLEHHNEPGKIMKFNPLIDLEEQDLSVYKAEHNLPVHPLSNYGYGSVGCIHCTAEGQGRTGRWCGRSKTECGLHQT